MDDATFLRRLCLDLCGVPPTPLEMVFFTADEDANKRTRSSSGSSPMRSARAYAAKRLGVPVENVQVVGTLNVGDGKPQVKVIVVQVAQPKVQRLAFSPDGKAVTVGLTDQLVIPSRRALCAQVQRVNPSFHRSLLLNSQQQPGANDSFWLDIQPALQRSYIQEVNQDQTTWLLNRVDDKMVQEWNLNTTPSWTYWMTEVQADPNTLWSAITFAESDIDFLKRVLKDARGSAPTALEEKYFAEDKDPKKREKLLDMLLKDPAVAKKLGAEWKKKMLAGPTQTSTVTPQFFELKYSTISPEGFNLKLTPQQWVVPNLTRDKLTIDPTGNLYVTPNTTWQWNFFTPENKPVNQPAAKPPASPQAGKFDKLVGELLAAKKSDAEMLEAITLAAAGRLPTDAEKKLTLGLIGKAADRKAAWLEVAKVLADTDEAKKRK